MLFARIVGTAGADSPSPIFRRKFTPSFLESFSLLAFCRNASTSSSVAGGLNAIAGIIVFLILTTVAAAVSGTGLVHATLPRSISSLRRKSSAFLASILPKTLLNIAFSWVSPNPLVSADIFSMAFAARASSPARTAAAKAAWRQA